MTEMVDRVARAMMDRFQLIAGPQLQADPVYWQEMAKFAIAAMREPTDAMCEAADWHQQSEVNQYQRAIDTALSPS